jgi:hypothetical protein
MASLTEREAVSFALGHAVTAIPDVDGILHFADMVDELNDPDSLEETLTGLECLITADIPGIDPDVQDRLVKLVDAAVLYCMEINDGLDSGTVEYRELSCVAENADIQKV